MEQLKKIIYTHIKENNIFYIALLLIIIALLPYICTFHKYGISSESDQWDDFGSYIGGIFSGLAFIAVIIQMQFEKKRFNEQRIEFENEKKEQEERRRKEDFERTFFMLLEQHNVKLFKLEGEGSKNSIIGELYDEIIRFDFSKGLYKLRTVFEYGDKKEIYSEINVYFLNLYRIMKFIDDSNMDDKKYYFGILRSYLSKKLLVILAFHLCKREQSYSRYIEFINEYKLLEHLDLISLEVLFLKNLKCTLEGRDVYEKLYKSCRYKDPNYPNVALSEIYTIFEDFDLDGEGNIIEFRDDGVEKNYKLLYELLLGKTEYKEVFLEYIDISPEEIDKTKVRGLLFEILNTFKPQAFRDNLGYTESHFIYEKFINYTRYCDSI